MQVLVANIPTRRNRYLEDLNAAVGGFCELRHSSDDFWEMRGEYDIVHLHWPEYMTYGVEAAYNSRLTEALTEDIAARLRFWSQHSRIVVTRHNPAPYNAPDDPSWRRVYALVYSHAAGVVHMANASVVDFRKRYPALERHGNVDLRHTIIPIQNYASLPNEVSRDGARRRLKIPDSARTLLVFGAIRTSGEKDLILRVFSELPLKNKFLLASNWPGGKASANAPLRTKLMAALRKPLSALHPHRMLNHGYVADDEVQYYLNAADVLFIPRLAGLNSANVSLGMTFGRVIAGPDVCNTGEILRERGNPVFSPGDVSTATGAVIQAFRLAEAAELGPANRAFAMANWSVEKCAALYAGFFAEVAGR